MCGAQGGEGGVESCELGVELALYLEEGGGWEGEEVDLGACLGVGGGGGGGLWRHLELFR